LGWRGGYHQPTVPPYAAPGRARPARRAGSGNPNPPATPFAAAATSEAEFFDRLRAAGLMVTLRESQQHPGQVTGYAVALAAGPGTALGQPIFFSGGRLAPELSLPKLRQRWGTLPPPLPRRYRTRVGRAQRVQAMRDARTAAEAAAQEMRRTARTDPGAAQATAQAAADTLHAVAFAVEGRHGGPLTAAAAVFDRAARAQHRQVALATTRSYQMRAMARLVALMGRVSGTEDTLAALHLILNLAALADTLAHLRDTQHRWYQAQAAREAAKALRATTVTTAEAMATPPVTPAPTAGPTVGPGRAQPARRGPYQQTRAGRRR